MTTLEQPSPDDEEWVELISQEYDKSEEKADKQILGEKRRENIF